MLRNCSAQFDKLVIENFQKDLHHQEEEDEYNKLYSQYLFDKGYLKKFFEKGILYLQNR